MSPPAAAAASPRTRPLRPVRAPIPRRWSGPLRERGPAATARRSGAGLAGPLVLLDSIANHRLFVRLVASKAWIGLIAFALIGIVTLQLVLLHLNTGIGRSLQREEALQRQNAALGVANSELAAGERIEGQATKLGMEATPAGALRLLRPDPRGAAGRAAGALAQPVQLPEASSPATGEASSSAGGEASSSAGGEAHTGTAEAGSGGSETPTRGSAEGSSNAAASAAGATGEAPAAGEAGGGAEASGAEAQAGGTGSG